VNSLSGATHLADLITACRTRVPDHPAVVDVTAATILTWAELDAAAWAEAARLRERGVAPGDRVAIRLPSGVHYCVALLGALRIGAIAVPYAPGAAARELEQVFADCGPTVVVAATGDDTAATAAAGCGATPLAAHDVATRAVEPGERTPGGGEDIALLIYTSGSTGAPRGVRLSHRALLANREQAAALRPAPITPVDRVLLALPMFHAYGLGAGFLQVCWVGATVVLIERMDPDQLVEVIVEHRVSTIAGVPSTFRSLLELPTERLRAATEGVRLCTSGGAPLPPRYLADFRSRTGLSIIQGYGLTEAGPVVTSNAVDGVPKPGSVGRPLPGIELRLVDAADTADHRDQGDESAANDPGATAVPAEDADADDGGGDHAADPARADPPPDHTVSDDTRAGGGDEDVFDAADGTGLVAIRGRNLFSGYWPDGAGGPDADGWFRTADVGFLDADGDLHLVDRSSDLVVVSGFNVYPREVEQVLAELPGVVEAAVVGVPDDRTGAAVAVLLIRAPGADLTADDVRAHCTRQLARFKVPTVIEFVDTLPRTPTGKVARRQLADEVRAQQGRPG
jgi:long-chain acyl-CoA synthetase